VAWHGPIVMNTADELRTAMADLRIGAFIKPAHQAPGAEPCTALCGLRQAQGLRPPPRVV